MTTFAPTLSPVEHEETYAGFDAAAHEAAMAEFGARIAAGQHRITFNYGVTLVTCDYCLSPTPASFMRLPRAGEKARHCLDCPPPVVQIQTGSTYDADDPYAGCF